MASCNGCGEAIGFKKFKFNKMWRIGGSYCKPCMMTVGANWEKYGKVTLPRTPCDLCRVDFFFLKPAWQGEKRKNFCGVCYRTAISGILPDKSKGEAPGNMPIPMMIFAGLGALMMVLGLLFTVVGTASGEMNLVNILFGSFTTAAGFLLLRRTLRNRRLIAGA
jgi:hypothetical protein|tara:strand:- start:222 stop:713 length:492 start_codon:yes stop_codon:yes gene_type:complete